MGGYLGVEDDRRGKSALVFMEMWLVVPGRIEAEPFGVDDLRGRQSVQLGRGRLIEQAREETQAFRQPRCRHLPAIMPHSSRGRRGRDGVDSALAARGSYGLGIRRVLLIISEPDTRKSRTGACHSTPSRFIR